MRETMGRKTFSAFLIFTFMVVSNSWGGSGLRVIGTARLHSMVVDNAYALEGRRDMPFTIIDARSKEEYGHAHIASAISIPEKDFDKSTDLLPKDKGVLLVVYCDGMKSGMSRRWADKAKAAGYMNISIYSEGFPVWKERHMPIAPLSSS
jgi:rhodanese-related sulfurtransferase